MKQFFLQQQDVQHSEIHHSEGFTSPPLNPHDILPPIGTPSTPALHKQHQFSPTNHNYDTSDHWKKTDYNLKHHLAKYLPADGSYLPKEPVVLSKDEELELRRLIREDLTGFNTSKLKDVYLELTGFDRHLTGCISYENLLFSLLRAKVGNFSQCSLFVVLRFLST